MARSEQSKQEAESTIRWDESADVAYLWTASIATRNVWRSYGFPLLDMKGPKNSGWFAKVPLNRISYKPIKIWE